MAKIKIPVITYKEMDFDFEKVWEYFTQSNELFDENGEPAFTTMKQLTDFLKDDFGMNCNYYLYDIFDIGNDFNEELFNDYDVFYTLDREYTKFVNKKFKGVHIKDIYNTVSYINEEE